MQKYFKLLFEDIRSWREGWYHYTERRLRAFALRFETQKDVIVDILMARRGTYQRPFLHLSLGILLVAGVLGHRLLRTHIPVDYRIN